MKQLSEKQLEKVWSKQAKTYQKSYDKKPDYLAHFAVIEQTIASGIGGVANKKILDVGSGTAITSAYLAKKRKFVWIILILVWLVDMHQKKMFS